MSLIIIFMLHEDDRLLHVQETDFFIADQLAEIRKTTLSKLICSNSQYARNIQPNAFLMPDDLTLVFFFFILTKVTCAWLKFLYDLKYATKSRSHKISNPTLR